MRLLLTLVLMFLLSSVKAQSESNSSDIFINWGSLDSVVHMNYCTEPFSHSLGVDNVKAILKSRLYQLDWYDTLEGPLTYLFVIEKDGSIYDLSVHMPEVSPEQSYEASVFFAELDDWIPGGYHGDTVHTLVFLTIH